MGRLEWVDVEVLGQRLPIRVWSPDEGALPLLVVHDGPEYDARAGLTRWAGTVIAREAVAPFRVAMLPPGERDEWYSASARYGRALARRVIPALRRGVDVAGQPVGMGASLGGLAMLQTQRAWPGTFAALFLQSASFFMPRFDRHESDFPRYGRIVRFVRAARRADPHPDPVPVALTCGTEEENLRNNGVMAAALREQGYATTMSELSGGHDWASWRAGFDLHLLGLLGRVWPRR
jgi:enterochelin esterase-like enzyme